MFARVKRWGNSFALRLSKKDVDELRVREGDEVRVEVRKIPAGGKVDLSGLPTFRDSDRRASERHDTLLYGE